MQAIVAVPVTMGLLLMLLATSIWPPGQVRHTSAPVEAARTPASTASSPASALADAGAATASPLFALPAEEPADSLALDRAKLRFAAGVYIPEMFDPDSADTPPTSFLADFVNPCWRTSDGGLRCLPLVHVLGGYQCAASDLFSRLAMHSDFAPPQHSSPSYYFEQNHKWASYLKTFSRATKSIAEQPARLVTGEGSAGMLSMTWTHSERLHQPYITTMGKRWQICNTNRTRGKDSDANFNACMQAHIATAKADDAALVTRAGAELQVPHLLRATQGTTVRLIALLRNPTNRLYAAFWHYPHYRGKFGASVSGFLKYHREMAGHLSACVQAHGLDACALKFESLERRFERVFYHVDQHFKGVYVPYVRRWSQTFSPGWRTCLLFLRTEDYVANTRDTLARVLSFAGLSAPDEAWWKRTLAEPVRHNGAPRKWSSFPPLPTEARQEVDAFFRPYNEELAALLGDEAFLWAGPSEPPHHLGAVR